MDIFFRQWWLDPRFKHNSSTPFNMAVDPTKIFWTPDTYFFNVKSVKYHFVTRENMRVMIYSSGKIYFSARYVCAHVAVVSKKAEEVLSAVIYICTCIGQGSSPFRI